MTEEELYNVKWWDYRILSPAEATLDFIKQYVDALEWHNKRLDVNPFLGAYVLKNIDTEHPETWKHWKTMTKLRQFADEHYMRYETFWVMAFGAIIELKYQTTYPYVFLSTRLQSWVLKRYEKQCYEEQEVTCIRHANNPFFKCKNYTGHPLQDAYYEHILSLYMKAPRNRTPEEILALIEDGAVPEEYLKKKAGRGK